MDVSLEESAALSLDAGDPLAAERAAFHLPRRPDGAPVRYFCGNSLGLLPRAAEEAVAREMDAWRTRAVEAWFDGEAPWYGIQDRLIGPLARIAGALEGEVGVLNALTVNLHLLLVSFYRPTRERYRILIDEPCFPSDLYAVKTHLRHRGLDPADALITVAPRSGEETLREEDVEARLARDGASIALVLLGGVNFLTGQRLDVERLTGAAHGVGAVAGFDLAHAAGNVELRLHDWDVDFATWCSYKYLNGGPGAPGAIFVHERHARDASRVRLGGWWGNRPDTRFRMQLEPEFVPVPSAQGWALSTPSVLALAPLVASLAQFDRIGMDTLRAKSLRLTAYLEHLLLAVAGTEVSILTPREPDRRGAQLSLRVPRGSRATQERLLARGIVCDYREPDVVRAAPAPLYNSFHDVWHLARALAG